MQKTCCSRDCEKGKHQNFNDFKSCLFWYYLILKAYSECSCYLLKIEHIFFLNILYSVCHTTYRLRHLYEVHCKTIFYRLETQTSINFQSHIDSIGKPFRKLIKNSWYIGCEAPARQRRESRVSYLRKCGNPLS